MTCNSFAEFREECRRYLQNSLIKLYPKLKVPEISFEIPPNPEFGELASSLCFDLAKELKIKPIALAEKIAQTIDKSKFKLVETVKPAGAGYINFHANHAKLAKLAVECAIKQPSYGYIKVAKPLRVIVEHTSANPIHPLHIGTARNPLLGDALARILKAKGHKVSRHFYIDDTGRQVAIIAYGYEKLGMPKFKPEVKPDQFIGHIYAMTCCLTEIQNLKKQVKELQQGEQLKKLQCELDDWTTAAADLEKKDPAIFNKLLKEINKDENPEAKINDLMKRYEAGEKNAKKLFRTVSQLCLKGFRETLERVDVAFDSWDWESDFVWNSNVSKVMQQLKKTKYVFETEGALELNTEQAAQTLNLKQRLGIPADYPTPSLTLTRSDGTTLYTTRDIAYSLWKFKQADRVINVIGVEQSLAQLQLKIALAAFGQIKLAENQTHFAFGLVELPGHKMSGRRGRYITFDQVIDDSIKRAYEEVSKRSPLLTEKEKQKIAKFVGIGAIKYAMTSVEPEKNIVFTWDRVLDFEKNSAPFIQYAHARACNILKKAKIKPKQVDYTLLKHPLERDLILRTARFPDIFLDAAENLKPDALAGFANELADKFNSFYASLPVIKAETSQLRDARLALVDAVRKVLKNTVTLLGITAPEKM